MKSGNLNILEPCGPLLACNGTALPLPSTDHVTPAGRVKRPSISNVCEWVKNSWRRVKSETIVKYLNKCGISNALDGSEDDILYEESDASSENNHEGDFSGSDDDFVGFYDE